MLRVGPKAMTVAVIIAGLLPIMFGGGTGSEVIRRSGTNGWRNDHRADPADAGATSAYLLLYRRKPQRRSSTVDPQLTGD